MTIKNEKIIVILIDIIYMCERPILSLKKNGEFLTIDKTKWLNEQHYKKAKPQDIVIYKCGKCAECRREKMFEMANRLKNELKIQTAKGKKAYFITYTYDEEHKKNLNKRDMQLYHKRLRKINEHRYFYVGELGENTERPHYHECLFIDKIEDIKEYGAKTKNGYTQYTSETIQKTWQNGLVRISILNDKLIWYCVKYMLKNCNKNEFIASWSRRPPIGIDEEKIDEKIMRRYPTRAEQKYYKYRHENELPKNENIEEQAQIKINAIEKQTGLKYYQYLKQKKAT